VPDVPLHRDVHPRQLFVDGERVTLIDWDLCGAGDPALDLANLLMHLELRWPQQAALLQSRLLAGWWSRAAPAGQPEARARAALARRLQLYRAFHALRRACKAWRLAAGQDALARPRTPTAADLPAIARWVDAADHHLHACRATPSAPACPGRPAAEIQP
jgi:aminoglycoside phosphotransferase (APT) family kinase protein